MKRNSLQQLFVRVEGKSSHSDVFHDRTNNRSLASVELEEPPASWTRIHFKSYPRLDRLPLLQPASWHLAEIIRGRRSRRDFSGRPISAEALAATLYAASGLIPDDGDIHFSRRPYPSAGARYPLEIYPLVLAGEGVRPGLYHYNVLEHVLEVLLEEDLTKSVEKATGEQAWLTNAAVIMIITAVFDRTRVKYGDRGYRYILLEAGHLGQNLCLAGHDLGLVSCCLGGFIDDQLNELLDITHTKERAIYLVASGYS